MCKIEFEFYWLYADSESKDCLITSSFYPIVRYGNVLLQCKTAMMRTCTDSTEGGAVYIDAYTDVNIASNIS